MATAQPDRHSQQFTQPQGAAGAQTGQQWDEAKGDIGEIAEEAVERGRHFLDAAKEQATDYVDQRKNELAQSVVGFAQSLRESAGSLGERPNIRALVDSAAGGLEQLAENMRGRSFGDMLDGVEGAVRRRPAVAAMATMAAGFFLARFVKASADGVREIERQRGRPGPAPRGQGQQEGGAQGPAPNPGQRGVLET
jgi:hypothetical protein